ncbi:oxygen-independent coproporphyrinogen-3 oxidase [Reichenbachiella faecimaris]|uniref:Heme chaperone HemW n=1 Tax=Reichenbachiella faecimaris TaxID=692418 RepID=A0A1W2GFI3_REIFA|nr:radical SAM family heme chaperone HemW [Reichenbachiella faecimaris]SMD35413.1 oxygen-independent coproporphyrinogen-3 oxidase [Reichenbachiella faecimaris]
MAGIYIHIPYCKQACHYCDFHFSTNLNTKTDLIDAILKEIELQKNYLGGETVETIYFGGGTPSLLSKQELSSILKTIGANFTVVAKPEITLEANPDDLTPAKLKELRAAGINRLSIGIQSFNDQVLKYFNRAHNAQMAASAVQEAQAIGFQNISIDIIFGVPNQSVNDLQKDLVRALEFKTQHISIYGLTIEDDTVFGKWEKQKKLTPLDEDIAAKHLETIMKTFAQAGYEQYEISNFCLPGFESKHNSSYWHGKKYLGLGPAAHSYNGQERQFNQAHNIKYIKQLTLNNLPCSVEILTNEDQINEFILTQLRLKQGLDCASLNEKFSHDIMYLKKTEIAQFTDLKMLDASGDFLKLTPKGKLLADFITEKLII